MSATVTNPVTETRIVELIGSLCAATVNATKAANKSRGWATADARERRAVTALFRAITGRKPTDAEINKMSV